MLAMVKQAYKAWFRLVDAAWSDAELLPDLAGRNSVNLTRCYCEVRQGVYYNINNVTVKHPIKPIILQLLHPVASQECTVELLI